MIAEVEQRGLAPARACATVADLLVQLLRIDPRAASARVRAARDLGPRRAVSGEALEPIFPTVAAATATGAISPAHARIVTATIDALPAAVAADHDRAVESFLTEQAHQFDPRALRLIARRLIDTLDPDGTLSTDADRARRRELTIALRPDGSSRVSGELDAICTEAVLTVLDTLARPTPTDESRRTRPPQPRTTPPRRTARRHAHPATHRHPARLRRHHHHHPVTMTAEQLQTGHRAGPHRTRRPVSDPGNRHPARRRTDSCRSR